MINYALVFALDNIGLGLGVIILVIQVAGSGGTYPVEVLPPIFRFLYPAMPFRYAMGAMKECVCGMYGDTYARCIAVLVLFTIGAAALGMLLYYPALKLNRMIAISMKKSDVMIG
jgi:putative membrane protein